jgi:hypothetical protein
MAMPLPKPLEAAVMNQTGAIVILRVRLQMFCGLSSTKVIKVVVFWVECKLCRAIELRWLSIYRDGSRDLKSGFKTRSIADGVGNSKFHQLAAFLCMGCSFEGCAKLSWVL